MPGGWSFDDEDDDLSAKEKANAKAQMRRVSELVQHADFAIGFRVVTLDLVCELNRIAVEGLVPDPGQLRQADNEILGSRHVPPPWQEVPALMTEMLTHLCEHQDEGGYAIAYLLWRLNWIHPFAEGNGRTARALVYLLVCIVARQELPGETTMIEVLARSHKRAHWHGLEAADAAWREGRIDVSGLQDLLVRLAYEQIESA